MSLVKKRESAKNKQTKKKLHYTGCFDAHAHKELTMQLFYT